ncbi:CRISPR-associated protein Cas5 [Clostridium carboxidivorans P7]|uniref:CRISPR-associated protein Cas5 n=1 Tax=Clostridium carboxidivorans P7 TaxID=536227 RepID=C6PRK1_9CLOT|nr:CRISPR-associated protein Cas5 [Clostridium carboxidivorans]AKN31465.1 CRISPR-associated protein Cas5 [Clostridium carboxidivorans P7]EET88182.1 CRISPR-associated protein Cas5 [Clostridium carboxidivorans P7]EFG87141.1 CRISPR-associated protein Cas5 [Clostridium carboxidivorans P7]
MELRKIEIVSDFAHFKKPFATKQQFTYTIPPISTVIGIIQNLFHEGISDFVFGFTFKYDEIFKDIQKIYKEVNFNTRKERERYNKNGVWTSDVCEIHYLVNSKLVIYTDIEDELKINECLNLGKTDCLARILSDKVVELSRRYGVGYGQWTEPNVQGNGFPERIAVETKYNGKKGYYDIYTKLVKLNDEFSYEGYNDDEMIYLWQYSKRGEISEFKQSIY